ncbi:MAG TPA: hypothetical protein VMV92_23160 [Streptosporangiaceae bacterium]|nr:hypothetical protein [Streptosporangiaceae bacterium]
MAGVVVLVVADEIRSRLGEPAVSALARRSGPGGRCLSCGRRLGPEPLSVRAYRDDQEIITLITRCLHHALGNGEILLGWAPLSGSQRSLPGTGGMSDAERWARGLA